MSKFLLAFGVWCLAMTAQAGIVIHGTRMIYPSDAKSIDVGLSNPDSLPALAQSWIEHGDTDNQSKIPFIITPPLTRVEAGTEQSLRVRHTGEPLAKDRESLFYLNILDVPPKPKNLEAESSYLQVTILSRLKFFYRPTNLPYSVDKAYDKVIWTLNGKELTFNNPTPYYISYAGVAIVDGEQKTIQSTSDIDMIAPFSTQTITLPEDSPNANSVQWYIINDYGATKDGITKLQ